MQTCVCLWYKQSICTYAQKKLSAASAGWTTCETLHNPLPLPPTPPTLAAYGALKLISLDPARTWATSSCIRYHFLINICIDPASPCRITGEYSHWFEQIREDKGCQISLDASGQQDMTARCAGDFQPGLDLMSVNCGIDTAAGLRWQAAN